MKDSSVVVRRKRTNKIKLLVSFNGAFRRQPPAGRLRYTGGETKIISVDRNLSFPKLKGRVLDLLMQSNGVSDVTSPFWMKYHLSDSQEDRPLISVSSDDDVRSMIEEFERLECLGKSTRLWVFVCFDCHVFDHGFVQKKNFNDKNSGVWRKTWNEGLGGENLMSPKKGKTLSDNCLRKLVLKQQCLGKRSDRIMCFKTDSGHAQMESVDEYGSGEPPVIDLSSNAIVESRSFSYASEFYRVNVLDYEYRNGTENFKKVSLSPVSKSHALNPKNCMSNDYSGQAAHLIFEKGDCDSSGRLCSVVKSPKADIGVDAVLCDVSRENIVPFSVKGNVERNRFLSIFSSHQLNGSGNQGNQRVLVGNQGCILYRQFGSSETRNFMTQDIFSEMENFHNFGLDGRSSIGKYHTGMRLSRNISKQWSISHQPRIKDVEGKMSLKLDEYGSGHVLFEQDGQEHVNGNKKCHFAHDPLLPVDDCSGATSSKADFSHISNTKTNELQFQSLLPDNIGMPANHESLSGMCNNVVPANVVLYCTHVSNRDLQRIEKSELEYVKELGSGTYGTVYHGKWKGSDVAIKRLKPSCFTEGTVENRLVADFWREAHILGRLHHPNIVALYGVVTDGPTNNLATVTEYMVNGSLKQVLRKKDRTIDCRKRLIIAMDAAFGMEYLHQKNVVHFDLKSHNFLVNMRDPQRPVCKIGDLGLSKVKQRTLVSGGVRGTIPWMAPELLNGETMVSEKVDVYSFGIVMWELLTGEEPYSNLRAEEIICGIIKGSLRPEIPSWCNPAWRSLMERCWLSDPKVRPPFSDIAVELRAMASAMNIK